MDAAPRPSHQPSWRWWVTSLLLLATAINYMDRVALSSVSVRVTHELGLNDAQYGDLETAFGWAFAAGSLVFGFLADRFRVYLLYPAVLVAWSLTGMATGGMRGYEGLLICRVLLGFFEAGHWPCALKTTFLVLDEKQRTMGNSVLQSGASIGAIITPQILKLLMTEQPGSWRSAFVAIGAFGLLWVVIWFLWLRPRDLASPQSSAPSSNTPALRALVFSRRFWAVAILMVGIQTVWHIYRVWLMKFLQTGRGYAESAALDFNSFYFVATDCGCLLGGVISLWLIRRRGLSPHRARRTVYAGACMLTSFSLLLPWLQKGWPLLATLLLIGAGALALFPCYYSFTQEISPVHVGRMTGLLSAWGWFVTSPLHSFFGVLIDHTRSYDLGLVLAGLAPWLGVLSMKWLWSEKPEPALALMSPTSTAAPYAD